MTAITKETEARRSNMPKVTILPMAKQGACQLGSQIEKRRGVSSLATGCAVGSVTFFDGCDSVEGLVSLLSPGPSFVAPGHSSHFR